MPPLQSETVCYEHKGCLTALQELRHIAMDASKHYTPKVIDICDIDVTALSH
jgi:hypothetical protein